MSLLQTAGRKLLEIGITKAAETISAKKPKVYEDTTGAGTTSSYSKKYVEQKTKEDKLGSLMNQATAFAPKVEGMFASTKEKGKLGTFLKEEAVAPRNTFEDYAKEGFTFVSSKDIVRAEKLKNEITSISSDKNSPIRTKLGESRYQEILKYRDAVTGIKEGAYKQEDGTYSRSPIDVLATGVMKGVPFGTAIANALPMADYSARETAREELARDEGMETYGGIETAISFGTSLGAYGAFAKVVDRALLGTKVTGNAAKIQNVLRESYAKNPTLFNLVSNSTQESIEYGVNKALGNDDFSLGEYVTGLFAGGIMSKLGSVSKENIFESVTQKDLLAIDTKLSKQKELLPDISDKELMDTLDTHILENGLTLGELKKSFRESSKGSTALVSDHRGIMSFFGKQGNVVSNGAAKKVSDAINETNELLAKTIDEPVDAFSNKKSLSLFKQDVLNELGTKNVITTADVDDVLKRKSKEYGIKLNASRNAADIFDEAEEVMLKGDGRISSLANPKTLDGFKYEYLKEEKVVDINNIYKIDEDLSFLKSNSYVTDKQKEKITQKEAILSDMLKKAGVENIRALEDKTYKITPSSINSKVKEMFPGKKVITSEDRASARKSLIKETRALEEQTEKIVGKMMGLKSTSQAGEVAKIVQWTQLKQAIETGDYHTALKTFVEKNKGIKAGGYWTDAKELEENRKRIDIENATREAEAQPEGKFKLSDDETASFFGQVAYAIIPFIGSGKGGRALQYFDNAGRVFERVFGKDSAIKKVLYNDMDAARSQHKGEVIDLDGNANRLARGAGFTDVQRQRKWMIYMTTRQGGVDDRITLSSNLYLGADGKIYDEFNDINPLSPKGKTSFDKETSRRLTPTDIENIIKEVESDTSYAPLTQWFDDKFQDVASRINEMHYNDAGVLIPTQKTYFPLLYIDANYYRSGEEAKNSLSTLFSTHVQDGFLEARKSPPNGFGINVDFHHFVKAFGDNQLYYLHMKQPVSRAKQMIVGANQEGVSIKFDSQKNSLTYNDATELTTGSPIMSSHLKKYVDNYIANVENRGVVKGGSNPVVQLANAIGTWVTIAWNPFSVLAQNFSLVDSAVQLKNKTNLAKGIRTATMHISQGKDRDIFKYAPELLSRQTEHTQGTALGKLTNEDLKDLSVGRASQSTISMMNDFGLRAQRKMDGEVSYAVFYANFYDYLEKEVRQHYPNLKITDDVEDVKNQIDEVWFRKTVNYAERNMVDVMHSNDAFTNASEASVKLGALYKATTFIQKTFINRMLFLNHHLSTGNAKIVVPVVLAQLALTEAMETEREYGRQVWNGTVGSKKLVPGDSHYERIINNNPSLTYSDGIDKFFEDSLLTVANIVNKDQVDELTSGQILAMRAMSRFFTNNIYNPTGGYELKTILSGISKKKSQEDAGVAPPSNRNIVDWSEVVIKTFMPNLGKSGVDYAHSVIFEEPLWETVEDNLSLGKKMKDNPERTKAYNAMSFEEQKEEANLIQGYEKTSKEVKKVTEEQKKKEDAIVKDIYQKLGSPVAGDEKAWMNSFNEYVKANVQPLKDAGVTSINEAEGYFDKVNEYDRKRSTGERGNAPTNVKEIYINNIKPLAGADGKIDKEKVVDEIKRLYEKKIILSPKSALENITKLLQKDDILK